MVPAGRGEWASPRLRLCSFDSAPSSTRRIPKSLLIRCLPKTSPAGTLDDTGQRICGAIHSPAWTTGVSFRIDSRASLPAVLLVARADRQIRTGGSTDLSRSLPEWGTRRPWPDGQFHRAKSKSPHRDITLRPKSRWSHVPYRSSHPSDCSPRCRLGLSEPQSLMHLATTPELRQTDRAVSRSRVWDIAEERPARVAGGPGPHSLLAPAIPHRTGLTPAHLAARLGQIFRDLLAITTYDAASRPPCDGVGSAQRQRAPRDPPCVSEPRPRFCDIDGDVCLVPACAVYCTKVLRVGAAGRPSNVGLQEALRRRRQV